MPPRSRSTSRPPAEAHRAAAAPAVRVRVSLAGLTGHRYAVRLRVDQPAARQRMSLPVWIPGSYLVREFARHLIGLTARQGGRGVPLEQLDKNTWEARCEPSLPLQLDYEVLASDPSVRAAWLDVGRAFFNGTSLFLRLHGCEDRPHRLELPAEGAPADWMVATALAPERVDARGFGRYRADGYDELVDSPVEASAHWDGRFDAAAVPHRLVVSGAPARFDGARLLADTRRICEAAIRFWHPAPGPSGAAAAPPHSHYLFLLNAVDDGYGGLEHRASTALVCARKDLPRRPSAPPGEPAARPADGYAMLLGLISHEYFHTWSVKRLRPRAFERYDYDRENATELLWFFEGFTSYYDDLLVRRAGLIDDAQYLRQLGRTLNQVLQTPGRRVQSVAQASFDAWTRYYRPDENTPNTTVSYYTKGAAVALCLDLSLRSAGAGTLDDAMRALWQRCGGAGMDEDDLLAVLRQQGGADCAERLREWVHGTGELPLQPLLEQHGVAVLAEPAQPAQALGLRVGDGPGIRIKTVLDGSPAADAGFMAQDEWLAIEPAARARTGASWRILQLDDLALHTRHGQRVTALVARDRRLLRLALQMPGPVSTWRLAVRDAARVGRWLGASGAAA